MQNFGGQRKSIMVFLKPIPVSSFLLLPRNEAVFKCYELLGRKVKLSILVISKGG